MSDGAMLPDNVARSWALSAANLRGLPWSVPCIPMTPTIDIKALITAASRARSDALSDLFYSLAPCYRP